MVVKARRPVTPGLVTYGTLGRAVQEYLDRGELVPDHIMLDMLQEAMIAAKAAGGGFVLDGIPRTMAQARAAYLAALEAMRPLLDYVPAHARLPVDLTGLGKAFGTTGVVAA